MECLQHTLHDVHQHSLCGGGILAPCGDTGLCELDVPVAVYIPDEVVYLLLRHAYLKGIKVLVDFPCKGVEAADDPLVLGAQVFGQPLVLKVLGQVHHNEAGGVPQLVGKVSRCLYLVLGKAHIISGGVACCQHEAQGIRTVFVDDLQRVNAVAQ